MTNTNGNGDTITAVRIRDTGPVKNLSVPASRAGGLYLARGKNETGKTTVGEAIIDWLSAGTAGDVEPRMDEHGQQLVGYVEGFGISVRHGKNRTGGGAPKDVVSLGGLDIGKIIEPRQVSPEVADRERINGLAQLLDLKGDPERFAPLVGGAEELKRIAQPRTLSGKTIVETAERLKTDLELLALNAEREVQKLESDVEAANKAIGDRNLDGECDEKVLADALADALRAQHMLEGRISQAKLARAAFDAANEAWEKLTAREVRSDKELQLEIDTARKHEDECNVALGTAAESVVAAEQARTATIAEHDERIAAAMRAKADAIAQADAAIASARAAKASAETAQRNAQTATRGATERLASLSEHLQQVAVAESKTREAALDYNAKKAIPTDEELDDAKAAVEAASKRKDEGAVIRSLRELRRGADESQRAADAKRTEALKLREQARGVWGVIADAVAPILPEDLRIDDGRLLFREGENEFFFSKLSLGKRTDIVAPAAGKALAIKAAEIARRTGQPRPIPMLVIDQTFTESLDHDAMVRLDAHATAEGREFCVYGAVCDEGPLRIVKFSADPQSMDESAARGLAAKEAQWIREGYEREQAATNGHTNGNGAHS